jgi:hypothetical protein
MENTFLYFLKGLFLKLDLWPKLDKLPCVKDEIILFLEIGHTGYKNENGMLI